jgi:peptidoglycan/LPS O-acetylase OafA/YrhL
MTIRQFLIARFFRIYPTLITALILYAIVTYSYCFFTYTPMTKQSEGTTLLMGLTLFDDFSRTSQSQYHVLWTLQIEWKFYLIVALMCYVFRPKVQWLHLILFSLISFVVCKGIWFTLEGQHYDLAGYFFKRMLPFPEDISYKTIFIICIYKLGVYIPYMFVGSIIYFHHVNKISSIQMLLSIITILMVTISLVSLPDLPILISTLGPIVLFLVLYYHFKEGHILRLSPATRFVADISYPLYLLHPIGYHLTSYLIYALAVKPLLAFILSISFILFLSHMVHVYIENPMNSLGKKLGRASAL